MATVDIFILVILAIGLISGLAKGFIRQACALVGLVAGLLVARALYAMAGEQLAAHIGTSVSVAQIISFIVIWAVVPMLLMLAGGALTRALEAIHLGGLNRLLGALAGVAINLLLLGDSYARNLGLNIKRARLLVISCAGILVAIVTAYCGPIVFLGLAVPHICRGIFQTSNHAVLLPASLGAGASLALVCNLIARMPGFEGALPVNSVTALVGAPVVMWVLFNKRKSER